MSSIRYTVTAAIVATFAVFVGVGTAVQYFVVLPSFNDLERDFAIRNARRCTDALKREIDLLSENAHDWAAWDDAYQFIQDRNQVFVQTNLESSLEATHINLLCFLDSKGDVVWSRAESPRDREIWELPDLLSRLQAADSVFRNHSKWTDDSKGIVLTHRGPILIASRPVVDSARTAPIRGTIVMGVFLDEALISDISDRTHVDLDVWTIPDGLSQAGRPVPTELETGESVHIDVASDDEIDAYSTFNDAWGHPALLLRARMVRSISAHGRTAARSATLCGLAGGVSILIVLWYGLRHLIIDPLRQVAAHVASIGRSGDLRARLGLSRRDEIGVVAREFDLMTAALAGMQDEMLAAAHKAGMADVATDVLHNVGNALSSANCSAELLDEQLRESKGRGLENAVKLLRAQAEAGRLVEFFSTDPRGPMLIDYLAALDEAVRQETADNVSEIERLRQTIRHICDAIAVQQAYAGKSNFRQEVDLAELLEGILRMHEHELRAASIRVERDFAPIPRVSINKPKIVQILINLVRNAIQSLRQCLDGDRTLAIRLLMDRANGVTVEIADTGLGIDAEVLPKLFTHGFTTKPTGNGFGLHYCANAVRELGGEIAVASAGRGCGATFRVRLPGPSPVMAV